jgi:hypothetical protein
LANEGHPSYAVGVMSEPFRSGKASPDWGFSGISRLETRRRSGALEGSESVLHEAASLEDQIKTVVARQVQGVDRMRSLGVFLTTASRNQEVDGTLRNASDACTTRVSRGY